MNDYTVKEQAAAVMQARVSWPQADALASDLEQAGLLRPEVNPITALRTEFAEANADGASSNDIVQLLDNFLVEHGQPTVLYA